MAHSLSAKKRIRQNEKRRLINRARNSTIKTTLRDCQETLAHGNPADAEKKTRDAIRMIDREAAAGLLHKNTAARRKSRLMARLNQKQGKAGAKG